MKHFTVVSTVCLALSACGGGGGVADEGSPPVSAEPVPAAASPPAAAPAPAPFPTPKPTRPAPAPAPTPTQQIRLATADQVLQAIRIGVPLMDITPPPGGPRQQSQWLFDSTRKLPEMDNNAIQMWVRTTEGQFPNQMITTTHEHPTVPDSGQIPLPVRTASITTTIEGGAVSVNGAPFTPIPNPVPADFRPRWDHGAGAFTELNVISGESQIEICWWTRRDDLPITYMIGETVVSLPAGPPIERLICTEHDTETVASTGARVDDILNGNQRIYQGAW